MSLKGRGFEISLLRLETLQVGHLTAELRLDQQAEQGNGVRLQLSDKRNCGEPKRPGSALKASPIGLSSTATAGARGEERKRRKKMPGIARSFCGPLDCLETWTMIDTSGAKRVKLPTCFVLLPSFAFPSSFASHV